MTYAELLAAKCPKNRVEVQVPGFDVRSGYRVGEFYNGRGKWVSVKVDGRAALNWYWHGYVKAI